MVRRFLCFVLDQELIPGQLAFGVTRCEWTRSMRALTAPGALWRPFYS